MHRILPLRKTSLWGKAFAFFSSVPFSCLECQVIYDDPQCEKHKLQYWKQNPLKEHSLSSSSSSCTSWLVPFIRRKQHPLKSWMERIHKFQSLPLSSSSCSFQRIDNNFQSVPHRGIELKLKDTRRTRRRREEKPQSHYFGIPKTIKEQPNLRALIVSQAKTSNLLSPERTTNNAVMEWFCRIKEWNRNKLLTRDPKNKSFSKLQTNNKRRFPFIILRPSSLFLQILLFSNSLI